MSEQEQRPKVYLVATGSYSDYSIDSVWTTEAVAEAYAALLDDAMVDERELFSELPTKVTIHRLEAVIEQGQAKPSFPNEDFYRSLERWEDAVFEGDQFWRGVPKVQVHSARPEYAWLRVDGVDRERAEKSFQDRLAKLKAKQAGVT